MADLSPAIASRIRGIVDALRRGLPAVIARLQRERTVITAITCDHRLKRGLEPMTAAFWGAGAGAPAWRRTQPPSRLSTNGRSAADVQGRSRPAPLFKSLRHDPRQPHQRAAAALCAPLAGPEVGAFIRQG